MKRAMIMGASLAILLGAPQLATAADGKTVYEKVCFACHNLGIKNAPKLGDKARWDALSKQGPDVLTATVIKGKSIMPPRAGTTLPDEDIKAAVEYLISQGK